jgi:hypothetical protein
LRLCFDVDQHTDVVGSVKPYRNKVGFQGVADVQADVTLIMYNDAAGGRPDIVELHGSGKDLTNMLRSALKAIERMQSLCRKGNGEVRPLPCPECHPLTDYPNATHTPDCKFWDRQKAQE